MSIKGIKKKSGRDMGATKEPGLDTGRIHRLNTRWDQRSCLWASPFCVFYNVICSQTLQEFQESPRYFYTTQWLSLCTENDWTTFVYPSQIPNTINTLKEKESFYVSVLKHLFAAILNYYGTFQEMLCVHS